MDAERMIAQAENLGLKLIAQPWSLREEGFRVHIGTPGETTIPSFKIVADGHVITTVYSRDVAEHLIELHNHGIAREALA